MLTQILRSKFNFNEVKDDSKLVCECNEVDSSTDENEDEINLMKSLGLPSKFATTKRYFFDKKDYGHNQVNSVDNHQFHDYDYNSSFLNYWHENGDQIVLNSWIEKYKDYIDNDFIRNDDDPSEKMVTETLSNVNKDYFVDERINKDDQWSSLWSEHYQEIYQKTFTNFYDKYLTEITQQLNGINVFSNDENKIQDMEVNGKDSNDSTINQSSEKASSTGHVSTVEKRHKLNEDDDDDEEEKDDDVKKVKKIKCSCESDEMIIDLETKSKRKNRKRTKTNRKIFWRKRYLLFSRFDEGIKLDEESWYSVTPEAVAKHIAERFAQLNATGERLFILDAFCGVGGNSIQFALLPNVHVFAVDIDQRKLEMAMNNARIYGVEKNIDFINADCMQLMKTCRLKIDAVFLSPPWGGPDYRVIDKYKLNMMTPCGEEIFNLSKRLTENIAFYLPRNIDEENLISVAKCRFEIEDNFVNNKGTRTKTAYFGDLMNEK